MKKTTRIVSGLSVVACLAIFNLVGCEQNVPEQAETEMTTPARLFPADLAVNQWADFQAAGYSAAVTGVVYRGNQPRPINGMPLGGIDTGCIDIETSGLIGWSTIFNHLSPRGGPVNTPILGVSVDNKTYVLATGEGKKLNNPANTAEVPTIFDIGLKDVELVESIDYWGHYPVLDMEFNSKCPVDVGVRAFSPFVPGDVKASMVPGAVFEVQLRNSGDVPKTGTVAFNFPGFEKHRPLVGVSQMAPVSPPERPYQPGAAPFDGQTLPEKQPTIARPNSGKSAGGRMVIADPSWDGKNEVLVGLKDAQTGRGFLASFQRNDATYGKALDGSGEYDYEIIDILENGGVTAIAVSDVDGDSKPDIIAGTEMGEVYVYKRKEAGFTAGNVNPLNDYERSQVNTLPARGAPITEVRVGDVNGDGKEDVVYTIGWISAGSDPLPGAYVIINGQTQTIVNDPQATFNGCALGDYNADGTLDVAVGSKGGNGPEQNFVKIYNFDEAGNISVEELACQFEKDRGPQWVVTGDFDGDGQDDILANTLLPSTAYLKRNNTAMGTQGAWSAREEGGTISLAGFSDPAPVEAGSTRTAIAVGDLNNSLLQRNETEPGGPNLGWKYEDWHTGGASDTMQAAAIGDISGDGVFDVLYWHVSRELGGHTQFEAAAKAPEQKTPSASDPTIARKVFDQNPRGIQTTNILYDMSYALTAIDEPKVRTGGGLGADGGKWSAIQQQLPESEADVTGGASIAVDFSLQPGQAKTVRFILAWSAPKWKGTGVPEAAGIEYTHMYAKWYPDVAATAKFLAGNHQAILKKIINWQEVLYSDQETPGWLADGLVNILHLLTECAVWGQVKDPILPVFRVEDGVFGLNECPRGCPQIECIPCSFYGNIPLPYFFPECGLSTLRGYKNYQFEDGRAPWIFGGCTAQTPPYNISTPAKGYQTVLNGACYVVMVDRHWQISGDDEFLKEFWDSVKRCCDFSFTLRPAYGDSQILSMPTGNVDTEWFEAGEPGWSGYVTHGGGIRMAQAAIARRMAQKMGDKDYEAKCDNWLQAGAKALEEHLWAGKYYLNFNEPETGKKSDFVFGYQLDGEWITDWHGIANNTVFPKNRVDVTLETIRQINDPLSESGVVNYANPDGSPAQVGGYGPYSYFPPELMMLSMNYMYEGHKEYGTKLLYDCMYNIHCRHGYTWDSPNIMRGDQDTGERTFGSDYYQDMMLWAVPAALENQSLIGPTRPGGLVRRILEANNIMKGKP